MSPSENDAVEIFVPDDATVQELKTFVYGALLQRITDSGAVVIEMQSGWNRAVNAEAGIAQFREAVHQGWPAFGITRLMAQEVPPLELPEGTARQ